MIDLEVGAPPLRPRGPANSQLEMSETHQTFFLCRAESARGGRRWAGGQNR